jgi:DNA-binding transcriptional ArsR family regulator
MSSRSPPTERPETCLTSSAAPPPERLDRVFEILQNRRRRLVLAYLRSHESTTLSDLARHVAAAENGIEEAAVSSSQRKRVYVSLYQAHLPKLDDVDAISFDRDRGTVERAPHAAELLAYLDRLDDRATQSEPTGGAFGVGTVALLAAALVVVFAGELGAVPADPSLGLAVLLSIAGAGAAVMGR